MTAMFGFALLVFAAALANDSKILKGNFKSVLSVPSFTVRLTFSRNTCNLLAS